MRASTAPERLVSDVGLFEFIGRDHAISQDEVTRAITVDRARLDPFWALYDDVWDRFCGSRLDPQFWRLRHPARWTGSIELGGSAVVIVGTGPSLKSALPAVRRVRHQVSLVTSPRGADALMDGGLTPDLVIVEHQTPVDAQYSVHDLQFRAGESGLAHAPLVAAGARTPAALVKNVGLDALFVPDPLPTWGLWPATAVALAILAGAGAIGLLGVDLGNRGQPDPRQLPLIDLLAHLAHGAGVSCADLGESGAEKPGWVRSPLSEFGRHCNAPRIERRFRSRADAGASRTELMSCLRRVAPLADVAEAGLAAACQVLRGDRSALACRAVARHLAALIDAGRTDAARIDVQDGLGCAFLPRYWRTPVDWTLSDRLCRPLALAAHELVGQYRSLTDEIARP